MKRTLRASSLLALPVLALGCGEAVLEEATERAAQPIIYGQPSPAEENAVVAIVDEQRVWSTGVVVAPTLVLTSRQGFVRLSVERARSSFGCNDALIGVAVDHTLDPAEYSILLGEEFPLDPVARGRRIFTGSSLDLCESDVALLEVDTPLDVTPLPLRLEAATLAHETGTLVGWGKTEEGLTSPRGALTLHGSRRRIALEIEAVGPNDLLLEAGQLLKVLKSMFVTGQGACYHDDGAPFISDETGAVVGLASNIEPAVSGESSEDSRGDGAVEDCVGGRGVFRRLAAPEYSWIKDAFRAAGQAPWYEGRSKPESDGAPCAVNQECLSGKCLRTSSRGFCSLPCERGICPSGMQCVDTQSEGAFCVPERIEIPSSEHACSVDAGGRPRGWSSLLPFALVLLTRRARKSKKGRNADAKI
jgi:hypothetical protein